MKEDTLKRRVERAAKAMLAYPGFKEIPGPLVKEAFSTVSLSIWRSF